MTAPAVETVLDAFVSRVEAIVPTLRTNTRFRRSPENAEASEAPTRSGLRQFDVDVLGGGDDSNEGRGVQNVGSADRTVSLLLSISYPAPGRAERALEKVIASDAELVLRAVGRSANWVSSPSAPVRRAVCRWTVNRSALQSGAEIILEVTVDVQYRDTE